MYFGTIQWMKIKYNKILNIYNCMQNYKIKNILLDDILKYDKEKYNSNNHWVNNIRPINYDFILSQTQTSMWINYFKEYQKITINNNIWIEWLKKASEICCQTGKFSKLFLDEFDIMVEELNKEYGYLFNDCHKGFFVRVNNVSLKYGEHKEGPYNNIRNILESIVSCIGSHSPLKYNTNEINIYLIKWIDIKPESEFEFRVFVFNNKITAISQQNIHSLVHNNYFDDGIFNEFIKKKLDIIVNYFYEEMISKITWISNYTFDFAVIDNKPYFIELNSFGKEYAAGSALYHWLLDEKILYNDFSDNNSLIEFRYTV